MFAHLQVHMQMENHYSSAHKLSLIHISYSGKTGLQVCQFLVRQENILVTAIGAGGASLLYLSLYLLSLIHI